MKKEIHPQYHTRTTITCSCGAELTTGSVQDNMTTEICSQCHPLYTGKKKIVDSTGRVDRFARLAQKVEKAQKSRKNVKSKEQKAQEREERTVQKDQAPTS